MWNQKSHHLIYSLLFVFSVVFISLFGLSSDSYAVSDFEVTLNSSHSTSGWIRPCGSGVNNSFSNTEPCSSYSYGRIIINDFSSCPSINFQLGPVASSTPLLSFDIFTHRSDGISNFAIYLPSSISSSSSCSLTYGVYTSNPYSDCPFCPEIPENPYDDKLDSIRSAIILVPAVCLLLYFFYVIFGIIIPTTGGKK